jgi:hypothetical protein
MPSHEGFEALQDVKSNNAPLHSNAAFRYQKGLDEQHQAGLWIPSVHLNADPWPPSDKARGQPICTGSGKKWAREQGKLELGIPPTKSQKRSDGNGSRSGSRMPSDETLGD